MLAEDSEPAPGFIFVKTGRDYKEIVVLNRYVLFDVVRRPEKEIKRNNFSL